MVTNTRVIVGKFIPVMKPSYASVEETMHAHHGTSAAEIKYDGYRIQVHKAGPELKLFTANGNEYNYTCYPEIVEIAQSLPDGIIEAELVGKGDSHLEVFTKVKKRFRREGLGEASLKKYKESGIIAQVPLELKVFDTLAHEGKSLINVPWNERRAFTELLDEKGISPSEVTYLSSVEDLVAHINTVTNHKEEGLVCKNPSSLYLPGNRTLDWIKFKRFDTIDLVIVGLYQEKSSAADLPFTGVLCATYNELTRMYETLGKVSVVRNRLADEIYPLIAGKGASTPSNNVSLSEKLSSTKERRFLPCQFIAPEDSVVLEVRAMNLQYGENWQSCGKENGKSFSMRIAYAQGIRYDKSPKHATTTNLVKKMYGLQK